MKALPGGLLLVGVVWMHVALCCNLHVFWLMSKQFKCGHCWIDRPPCIWQNTNQCWLVGCGKASSLAPKHSGSTGASTAVCYEKNSQNIASEFF